MITDINNVIISPNITEKIRFDPKLKLGILASGKGSNFEAIILDINSNRLDAEIICLIVNEPDCKAIEKAKKYSIPYFIIDHRDYKSRESFDEEIIKILVNSNVEGIIMVGWMRIVTQKLLHKFHGRVVNLHPSLLPSFKGNNAIKKAIYAGVKIIGC